MRYPPIYHYLTSYTVFWALSFTELLRTLSLVIWYVWIGFADTGDEFDELALFVTTP